MSPGEASRLATACVVALVAAGCGGEGEQGGPSPPGRTEATTQTEAERTDSVEVPTGRPRRTETRPRTTSPEDEPGGAGDEEPARTEALVTGRGGRLSPRIVRVPPFIAVRVVLRSGDGSAYALRLGRATLRVDGRRRSASADVDGMRPGESLAGGGVRIEASAEPGP